MFSFDAIEEFLSDFWEAVIRVESPLEEGENPILSGKIIGTTLFTKVKVL